jgi:hypothetical protein
MLGLMVADDILFSLQFGVIPSIQTKETRNQYRYYTRLASVINVLKEVRKNSEVSHVKG